MERAAIRHIFVYGTLQRGEVRERCWPRQPVKIESATVRGALYDLGPYPALVEGDDLIAGELWQFTAEDLPPTLAALDKVEGFQGNSDDLYRRTAIQCQAATGSVSAWTYLYAHPSEIARATAVPPGESGSCRWSRPSAPADDL